MRQRIRSSRPSSRYNRPWQHCAGAGQPDPLVRSRPRPDRRIGPGPRLIDCGPEPHFGRKGLCYRRMMLPRKIMCGEAAMAAAPQSTADSFIIETHHLTKEFSGFVAVSKVDLRVRRGQIHALIGPNGAGKTTFFNLLTKFLIPTRGQIVYR